MSRRRRPLMQKKVRQATRKRPLRFEPLESRMLLTTYSVYGWDGPDLGAGQLTLESMSITEGSNTRGRFVLLWDASGSEPEATLTWRLEGTATGGIDFNREQTGTIPIEGGVYYFDYYANGEHDDDVFEGTESVTFTVESIVGSLGTVYVPWQYQGEFRDRLTNYINDDEKPIVSIASAGSIMENGAPSDAFTVSIAHPIDADLTVYYTSDGSTATAGADYETLTGFVTIPEGHTTKSFSVSPRNDCIYEGLTPEIVNLTLSDGSTYDVDAAAGSAQLEIDDDETLPFAQITNWSGAEPLGSNSPFNATFTVTLVCSTRPEFPGLSVEPITIPYWTANGSAQEPGDYLSKYDTLTFELPETSKNISITVNDDSDQEPTETFLVEYDDPYNGARRQGVGTIFDDDLPPVVRIEADSEAIEGSNVAFTVTLSRPVDGALTVPYSIIGLTANANDYDPPQPLLLEFGANQTTATITIATVNDPLGEQDETFKVILQAPAFGTLDSNADERIGTILDDEPRLSITAVGLPTEHPNNTSQGQFKITYTRRSESGNPPTLPPFTAHYDIGGTANNSGPAKDIIQPLTGEVTINSSETYIYFTPFNDALFEQAESLIATLTAPSESPYSLKQAQNAATALIYDNDQWKVKTEPTTQYSFESGSAPAVLRVTRYDETDATYPLTVHYLVDGTATAESDYVGIGESITIPAGATYVDKEVHPLDDQVLEQDESVGMTLQPNALYTLGSLATASAWIQDNEKRAAKQKCTCDTSPATNGALQESVGDGEYNSGWNPHPIVSIDVAFVQNISAATSIEVQLTFGGLVGDPVFYNPATLTPFTPYRFALMADATTLSSGSHAWQMAFTTHFASGLSATHTYNGHMAIANRIDSEFGNRWWHQDVDRLYVEAEGVTIIGGDGNGDWYAEVSPGTFEREAGELGYSTLVYTNNQYVLSSKHGAQSVFNSNGILISKSDRIGNTTTFTYVDADSDGATDELKTIVDPRGRTTTFNYTGPKVSSSVDHAGRTTTYGYTNGYLTSITHPDPDGAGQIPAPVDVFAYNPTTGLMSSHTDGRNRTTSFQYRANRTLERRTYHDNSFVEYSPAMYSGFVNTANNVGSQSNPAPLVPSSSAQGWSKNENGKTTYITTDAFGQITKEVDPLQNVTTYERDEEGRVKKMIRPDPDGTGPQSAITTYHYDTMGNVVLIEHPTDVESRFYNYELNLVESSWDMEGNSIGHVYDYATGLLLQRRHIMGNHDQLGGPQDDLVTTYTYTPAPTTQFDPPEGLLHTETDPLGRVTQYYYNALGQLTVVGYAIGSGEEAYVSYQYDAVGNLKFSFDELNRKTSYEYDDLDRLVKMTLPDPDGPTKPLQPPVYQYEYNGNNKRTREIDPLERDTWFNYNDRGSLTSIVGPDHDDDGNSTITINGYDAAQRLTSVTDALGRVTIYGYNDNNQQTRVTLPDPEGLTGPEGLVSPILYTDYDVLGRVKEKKDALSNLTSYTYQINGMQEITTLPDPDGPNGPLTSPVSWVATFMQSGQAYSSDAVGAETAYLYDDAGRLIRVTGPDPDGPGAQNPLQSPVTNYSYDKAGNLLTVTDARGGVTEYFYDARNRLVRMLQPDPDGNGEQQPPETIYTYDAAGQLLSVLDPLLRVTTYEYDGLGRLVKATLPDPDDEDLLDPPTIEYKYDIASRLTDVKDTMGKVTSYGYDALDNLTSVTAPDPDGGQNPLVTVYVFDAAGQLKTVTDPKGGLTTYEYDDLGRTTKVLLPDPDGANQLARPFTEYKYYADGSLREFKDENTHITTHFYDNLRRLTSTIDAEGGETKYNYDAVNNLTSLEDAEGNTTTWEYDKLRRVTLETNELGKTRRFKYDPNGNLTERVDRMGRKIVLEYDKLNRNTFERWYVVGIAEPVRTIGFTYDAASQLKQATDPTGTYGFEYDGLGRAEFESQSLTDLGPLITYDRKFNAAGNVTELAATIGNNADFKNVYEYDDLQRLKLLTQQQVVTGNVVAEKRVDFTYTATGRFERISRYADLAATEHVVSSHYLYDGMHRLAQLSHATSTTPPVDATTWGNDPLAGYRYNYDPASRIQQITSFVDGVSTYTYDQTNQLTGADHDDLVPELPDETYEYDDNGNRTGLGYDNNPNNQLGSDGIYTYQYDDEGNRTRRTSIATGEYTEYQWDHRNRLVYARDYGRLWEAGIETEAWGWGPSSASAYELITLDPQSDLGYDSSTIWVEFEDCVWDEELQQCFTQTYSKELEIRAVNAIEGNVIEIQARWLDENGSSATFEYSTTDGSADGSDYSQVYNWTTMSIGSSTEFEVIATIATQTDFNVEGSESFEIKVRLPGANLNEAVLTPSIFDPQGLATFGASVESATEGAGPITLTITADKLVQIEWWVEYVSAVRQTSVTTVHDYTVDANDLEIYGGTLWASPSQDGTVQFAVIDDALDESTQSFRVVVRIVGGTETIEVEADIFDNDESIFEDIKYVENSYDVFNRLVRRRLDADGEGPNAAVDRYFSWEGNQIALQFDGGNLSHRYLYGPAVDQILADENVSSLTQPGTVLYPLADHLGTPRDIATYDGTTTAVVNHRIFDSFGVMVSESNANFSIAIGFTGVYFDSALGLNYHRNRWLDLETGRWLSEDPIGFAAGDTNLSRYVGNHPTISTDPSGLQEPGFDPDNSLANPQFPLPPTTGKPAGMSQEEFERQIRLAAYWSPQFSRLGTPIASSLHDHWREGSGNDYNLSRQELGKILKSRATRDQMNKVLGMFKEALSRDNTLTATPMSYNRKLGSDKLIEFTKPPPVSMLGQEADLFYSFHDLRFTVSFTGEAWCEGEKKFWKGIVAYKFHDDYKFTNRDAAAIPVLPWVQDRHFWLWETYGSPSPFKVKGEHKEYYERMEATSVATSGGSRYSGY